MMLMVVVGETAADAMSVSDGCGESGDTDGERKLIELNGE
jgi:hypothetical protein